MIGSILQLLTAGLSLWESKEKDQYLKRVIELETQYHEELKKVTPDNNVLDDIYYECLRIGRNFATAVHQKKV